MRKNAIALFAVAAAAVVAFAADDTGCAGELCGWRLQWADEFDGTSLDTNVWQRCKEGKAPWCRHMSERPDLVSVGGGFVTMRGVRNDGPDKEKHPWLTGGIKNLDGPAISHLKRGKVLIRARFQDHQKGAWPALWMCGAQRSSV